MDPYGQENEQWTMGNFFEYNRKMRDLLNFQTRNLNNSSNTINSSGAYNSCTFFETGIQCKFFSCKCKEDNPDKNESITNPSEVNNQNDDKIRSLLETKSEYEKVSSLSPIRESKSLTPVRDEPVIPSVPPPANTNPSFNANSLANTNAPINVNEDGRNCSYFRKGLPCPFPACKYKCYDVPERLPFLPKKQTPPNTDPNVKLCDYYKYDRPCPFPRCRYKCYSNAEKQQHFDMGYIKPVYNNSRHSTVTNNTNGRDIDHRSSAPSRRDSWEAKCDEFIRNMFVSKPSTSPPSIENNSSNKLDNRRKSHENENKSSDGLERKRKSHERDKSHEMSPRKRSKKKRSHDRDRDDDDHSSKKKKSKKDKKEKKSKKSKKERSKDKESSFKDSKRSRSKSDESKPSKNRSPVSCEDLDSSVVLLSEKEPEIPAFNPSPAFVEFIIKNFRKKSKKKLPVEIQLEGIFKSDGINVDKDSSEDDKVNWITRKTLDFLNEYGYNEDKIYDISTLMEGETLEKELKNVVYNAVKEGKIGHSKAAMSQLFHVIELGKKCLIFQG